MHSRPKNNQKINTTIMRLGINGEGIGHWNNYTVFIDGALPGEVVQAEITEAKKTYGRGRLTLIETPSPHRVKPICPLFGTCGGCQLMHLAYQEQLNMKRQRVVDALERIGKIFGTEVQPCIPSPAPLAYRNKIQIPILPDGFGSIKMGLYARQSHDLIEVDHCYIHNDLGEEIWQEIALILKNSGISAYDRFTQKGVLRHLIIKTAINTGQAMAVLVTNGIGDETLVAAAENIMLACPSLKGVVQNVNNNSDNVVLSEEFQVLAGISKIEENLCGLRFMVSPASFFQVNPAQALQLYLKAVELSNLTGEETVLDVYCGVGTLALIFATKVEKVYGVECVPQAIQDAKDNADINKITNTEFVCAQAEDWIKEAPEFSIVLLNPPRKGCDPWVLEELAKRLPKTIIYISCDPATLARDLAILLKSRYAISYVQPFDMFPQTAHVECIVKLQLTI